MGKKWYQSKTIIANVVGFLAMGLTMFAGVELPAGVEGEAVAAVMALVNLVLRFVTSEPIA